MSRRSGRKSYTSTQDTTSDLQPPLEEETLVDEEEDSVEEEDDEITRCICGHDELQPNYINKDLEALLNKEFLIKIDHGLFIQCDRCGVWQHGYCVGLFENDDVPEKYWCELCKPELHIIITEGPPIKSKRTLYKPVNDRRRKIEQLSNSKDSTTGNNKRKRNTPPNTGAANNNNNNNANNNNSNSNNSTGKLSRKERRHHHHHFDEEEDDEYKEALQRAIRESAKESGVALDKPDDSESGNSPKRRSRHSTTNPSPNQTTPPTTTGTTNDPIGEKYNNDDDDDPAPDSKRPKIEVEGPTDSDVNDLDTTSALEDDTMNDSAGVKREPRRGKPRAKISSKSKKAKLQQPTSSASSSASSSTKSSATNGAKPLPSREELINQPSKPRYVSDRSSIYELRKRTGAILEWLARSQLELEEEKSHKLELFNFQQVEVTGDGSHDDPQRDAAKLEVTFNENLVLMEKLTEKILNWEQNFGKYAP